MIPTCTELFGNGEGAFDFQTDSQTQLEVSINYSSGTFCFETEPAAVDPNLFYDASQMMRVKKVLHQGTIIFITKLHKFGVHRHSFIH